MALAAVIAELDTLLPVCSVVKPGDLEWVSLWHPHFADRTSPCREEERWEFRDHSFLCAAILMQAQPFEIGSDY